MGRTLRIETPRAFRPLLKPARYKGAFGGRGGGKSWDFAGMLLELCLLRPGLHAVCVREIQQTLGQSVKQLLENLIERFDVGYAFRPLASHIETPGGGRIDFRGMQTYNADNIKSLEGYDVAWVEEAQMLSKRSLDLLRPTIRKEGSELWFSWNPRNATDPIDVFLRGKDRPKDSIVVEVSYKDNPWFTKTLREEMEWDRAHDPAKYQHVWMGQYEELTEARVFNNWRIEDFDTPEDSVFYFGADWGFSVDPTALVRCWIDGRRLYVDREAYAVGCEIEDTPALFDSIENGQAREWVITADSARPETISYMRKHGFPRMKKAKKGEGSVEEGVKFLQSYDIIVHPRCKHTIDELTLYRYKTDKLTGQVLPKLEDKQNHVIDSLRYATEQARKAMRLGGAGVQLGYAAKRSSGNVQALAKPLAPVIRDEESDHEGAVSDPRGAMSERSRRERSRSLPDGW